MATFLLWAALAGQNVTAQLDKTDKRLTVIKQEVDEIKKAEKKKAEKKKAMAKKKREAKKPKPKE